MHKDHKGVCERFGEVVVGYDARSGGDEDFSPPFIPKPSEIRTIAVEKAATELVKFGREEVAQEEDKDEKENCPGYPPEGTGQAGCAPCRRSR